MTSHLPEYSYLVGEREAEIEEARDAQVGDGRDLWSPVDLNLLYSAEDLQSFQEWEGEAIAEYGANEFYGCGAAAFNSSDAMFLARERINAQFRRTHRGMSKGEIDNFYANMFTQPEPSRKFKYAKGGC